jgi:lysosomal Pro-X carboxypeptidase
MATNSISRTLTFTLTIIIIIIISSSHQPLALNHTPRFFGKFSTSTIPSNSQPQFDFHYETKFFQQQLDHFSFSNLPTFPQRYLINTQNWVVGSGPIFLYCGNEGDIVWFAQNTGFVWEIAPKFGAMVVFPEVRVITYYSLRNCLHDEDYGNLLTGLVCFLFCSIDIMVSLFLLEARKKRIRMLVR